MLENIIINPIDVPRGYINPSRGIALRGSLAQFFSGIYLKPLNDAFNQIDVTTLRYQDDILILCNTKLQMKVLSEKHLSLSRKKSRMGCINRGFHFLGIHYLPARTDDYADMIHVNDASHSTNCIYYLYENGGGQ